MLRKVNKEGEAKESYGKERKRLGYRSHGYFAHTHDHMVCYKGDAIK